MQTPDSTISRTPHVNLQHVSDEVKDFIVREKEANVQAKVVSEKLKYLYNITASDTQINSWYSYNRVTNFIYFFKLIT